MSNGQRTVAGGGNSGGGGGGGGGGSNTDPGAAQKSANLSDLTDAGAARTNLGLGAAAIAAVGTASGTVAAGNDSRITGAAQQAANLSDLASAATARTNLGLGAAAVAAVGTTAGTVAAGNDSRITGAAQQASNLSDLASAATARTNLGLGAAAVAAVGTGAGTVAAGNDSRITGAAQQASNLSDLANVTTARTNLGLGTAAVKNVGTTSTTVAAGAHAAQHQVGGGDEVYFDPRGRATGVIETISMDALDPGGQSPSINAGAAFWTYFTPDQTVTVTQMTSGTRNVAQSGSTLAKMGLYSVDGSGNLTCIARTASDTTMWNVTNYYYTRSIVDDGQGASISSVTLTRGQRYAFAVLSVGHTTSPLLAGKNGHANLAQMNPRRSGYLTGATDLQGSVTASAIAANTSSGAYFYGRLS